MHWIYLISTTGTLGFFMQPWVFGLLALGFLASGCDFLLLAIKTRRIVKREVGEPIHTTAPALPIPVIAKEKWKTASKMIGMLLIGGTLGWGARDIRQFHHTYVLNDLSIVAKQSESEYTILFNDTHQAFQTRFCSDYTPAFYPGLRLKELVYEDRGNCWSISDDKLGYIIARD